MIIGTFKAEGDGYAGQISALGLAETDITFRPVKDKKGDGPDFIIIGCGEMIDLEDLDFAMLRPALDGTIPVHNANTYDAGAAWKKTDETGKPYLAVKLDGPTFAAAIDCALVGPSKKGHYRLIWTRKNQDDVAAGEQAAA
jgi:uncharacterized protein (DUF736 family)